MATPSQLKNFCRFFYLSVEALTMPVDASYSPQPLALPPCWVIGVPIGPITMEYDGASLVGSTIRLTFSGGLSPVVASFVEDFSVEFPERHIVTFPRFLVTEPSNPDLLVTYKINILYSNGENLPLYYGEWQLRKLNI